MPLAAVEAPEDAVLLPGAEEGGRILGSCLSSGFSRACGYQLLPRTRRGTPPGSGGL